MTRAQSLRDRAKTLRRLAQYAEGASHRRDLDLAAALEAEAAALERQAPPHPLPKGRGDIPPEPAGEQRRRARHRALLVKKINVARRQLGWDEATWETVKLIHGNCRSIAATANPPATIAQLEAILDHARALGFQDRYKKANGRISQTLAQDAQARLLRHLWLDMHTLGAVNDPDETALCHWLMATRKGAATGGRVTTSLKLLPAADLDNGIERLKRWRLRWLKSGQLSCPECGRAFTPTDQQARAFGKIACTAHPQPAAYRFIPPAALEPAAKKGEGG